MDGLDFSSSVSPFSQAIVFLKTVLGNVFGNMPMIVENTKRVAANINHPNHQAPNHRGSSSAIVGVKDGAIYSFKQILAKLYPAAGPSIRKKKDKPEIKGG